MGYILLTNDDGFGAAGLEALYQACLKNCLNPLIVAPARNCSGYGHGATFHSPVRLDKVRTGFIVHGTPADCVYIAIHHLALSIDAIFSGINSGANLGDDIWYSGTVAAAREGALHQIPSFAFSQVQPDSGQLSEIADYAIALYQQQAPHPGHLFNYNFPPKFEKKVEQGFLGRRYRGDTTQKVRDARGKNWVWLGAPKDGIIENGSDFDIISRNIISLTISGC